MLRKKAEAVETELNRFSSCLNVVFTIPSATSTPRTFCALRLTNYDGEF